MSFFDPNFIVPMNSQYSKAKGIKSKDNLFFDYMANPLEARLKNDAGFKNIFTTAVQSVIETDHDYTNKQYLLATGQIDNVADVTIAGAKAQLAVELLVQLRNSAITAYNEVLRINV